jgi:NAD(P)-dependent dehydrogenase (short-subunit alcohol dehydrogenase family)
MSFAQALLKVKLERTRIKRSLEDIQISSPEGKIPLTGGEPGPSDAVARLVHFLASPASAHVTGTEIWIDGGQSLL